ncbi:MAG: hypothetical protein BWY60_00064 [Actinobacteria bacterium ADurb.Bin346]|nr:MAG: hypothetical protein BWY60_00064 [Actinobacteria bacterium ADurb.Bin346]
MLIFLISKQIKLVGYDIIIYMKNLKKIKTLTSKIEAEIAKGFLQSNGIDSFIFADDAGDMYPAQDLVYGVSLMVNKCDFRKAKELLDALEFETEDG